MTDFNSTHNRIVWCDISVDDLERAANFYHHVLDIKVHTEEYEGSPFCILDHKEGNGGCLVKRAEGKTATEGDFLVYFNVDKRIKDAVKKVKKYGGKVVEKIHSIGPHGCRAIVLDSEGNRIALHSTVDA